MTEQPPYDKLTDADLVDAWQKDNDEAALDFLIRRYYPIVFRRLRLKLSNIADAQEVTQDAFIKLVNSLENYSDEGKFSHFLNTVVSSQLVDFYRKHGKHQLDQELDLELPAFADDLSSNVESGLFASQKVDYLTKHCIPQLPALERMVFLLMHESELWDFDTPLEWSHVATLNAIDQSTAWQRFESAREALMKGSSAQNIDPEELLVFLLWTQAKRPNKIPHTLQYFANLLGEAEQNLRNRSHKAKKNLEACLAQFVGAT